MQIDALGCSGRPRVHVRDFIKDFAIKRMSKTPALRGNLAFCDFPEIELKIGKYSSETRAVKSSLDGGADRFDKSGIE